MIAIGHSDDSRWQTFAHWLQMAGFFPVSATDDPEGVDLVLGEEELEPLHKSVDFLGHVRSRLREQRPARPAVAFGAGSLNLQQGEFVREGETRPLTPLQIDLLELLLGNVGRVVSRADLYSKIWGQELEQDNRTVDQLVLRLRRVIEQDPSEPEHLLHVRGVGYRLVLHVEKPQHVPYEPQRPKHNLPYFPDTFYGRAELLETVGGAWNSATRLWTLLGPGGVGKTRFSVRLGQRWASTVEPAGGVWFCELTQAHTMRAVLQIVGGCLGVEFAANADENARLVQLAFVLKNREEVVLILDNCEQVMEPVRALVRHFRAQCPNLRLIATSRERLRIRGERGVEMAALAESEAIALFYARANWEADSLSLEERRAVSEICALLDNLPLAIELAASRANFFGASDLKRRLVEPFRVLKSNSSDLQERQRSLQAALQWSWDLLSPWEQATLAECSCFRGGFSLEAAEAVVDLSPWPKSEEVEFILEDLIDKSLMHTRMGPDPLGRARFSMLTTTHGFAEARLGETRGQVDTFRRHAAYFSGFGTVANMERLRSKEGPSRYLELIIERPNFFEALSRASARGWQDEAVELCLVTVVSLNQTGPLLLGIQWIQTILEMELAAEARQQLLNKLGWSLKIIGQPEKAQACIEQSLTLAETLNKPRAIADTMGNLAVIQRDLGNLEEATHLYRRALKIAQDIQWTEGEATITGNLGMCFVRGGGLYKEGETLLKRALSLSREVGDTNSEANILNNLAGLFQNMGRNAEAMPLLDLAIQLYRESGNRRGLCQSLSLQAFSMSLFGKCVLRIELYLQALKIARDIGDVPYEGVILGNLGVAYRTVRKTQRALECCHQALAIYRMVGDREFEGWMLMSLGMEKAKDGDYEEAMHMFEQAEALLRDMKDLIELGMVLSNQGKTFLLMKNKPGAIQKCTELRTIVQALGVQEESQLFQSLIDLKKCIEYYESYHLEQPAPTGVITLVFTDIVDTTHLWATLGEDFLPLLAQHDEIIMSCARRARGYVVKNDGDSFMVAFANPVDALTFSTSAQQGLRNAYWKPVLTDLPGQEQGLNVRFGMHTGLVLHRINPMDGRTDYFGATVNLAFRIAQVARGGQILVSKECMAQQQMEDVESQLLPPIMVKGFDEPIEVMEILLSEGSSVH